MKEKTVYLECKRYMDNAKEILQKAKKDNGIYKDIKYVQTACGTAYNAVLLALDEYLIRKEPNKPKSKDIEDYKKRISRQNKTILKILLSAYDELHLAGYYHGTQSAKTVQSGFENAYKIIEFVK
ncbi:MAG: DUF5618 family protein [Bacteroidales bacterium]|nr:DUF5618 family protein [Bacteroidales bacterium]